MEESNEIFFQCLNPQNKNGHIVYTCKGVDEQGDWAGERRYNEFHALREKLEQRWPGIPIPRLPAKKAIGNKDIKFINERRFYLERFLKKISSYGFLMNAAEFKIFTRPNGDIGKLIGQIPKASTQQIVEKYREALQIQEHLYDPIAKDKLDNACKEFQHFAKQILPVLGGIIKCISLYMTNKS